MRSRCVGFITRKTSTVEQANQLQFLFDGDMLAAFRICRGKYGEPASRPTERRTCTLHPIKRLGGCHIILGTHGAKLNCTESFRRETAHGVVRLLVCAAGRGKRIGYALGEVCGHPVKAADGVSCQVSV